MDLQLTEQIAVVTGAAAGIGHAIAARFAEHGANVVLLDQKTDVNSTATELGQKYGVNSRSVVCDVADASAMRSAAAQTISEFGRCDHLVCAAGAGSGKYGFPFWNLDPDDWHAVLQTNLMGVVHAAHAFAPAMTHKKRGTMLFLSSVAGQIGSQTDPPYSAAKAAVINFAQCAAKDLATYDVRVNVICPGMIATSLNRAVWKSWCDRQPEADWQPFDQWAAAKIAKPTNPFSERGTSIKRVSPNSGHIPLV